MEQTGELSVTAKTLSTDNYLQITELMQAHASERGNIIFSLLLDSNHRLFQEDFTKLTEVALFSLHFVLKHGSKCAAGLSSEAFAPNN